MKLPPSRESFERSHTDRALLLINNKAGPLAATASKTTTIWIVAIELVGLLQQHPRISSLSRSTVLMRAAPEDSATHPVDEIRSGQSDDLRSGQHDALLTRPERRPPLSLVYGTLCLANAAEAVEVLSAGSILQRASDDAAGQTAIAAGVFVGMLFGGFASGAVADTVGRAYALRWALTLAFVAAASAALAPNLPSLVLLRVLAGTGVGAATPPLFALATENAPVGRTGPAITLVASFWMVGAVIAAALALLMLGSSADAPPSVGWSESWRGFALACSVVPAISTTLAWTVNLTPPSIPQEISPSPSLNDSIADQPTTPLPPAAEPMTLRRVLTTLSAPAERAALLPLCLVWAGLNFGSYGLSTWITTLLTHAGVRDPYLVALLYAVAMLPGNLLSVFCIDTIGRRTLLVGSMVAASLSALALGAVDTSSSEMVIAAACLFSATSTASWNALDVLSTEAFGVEVGLPWMTSDCP